jgi:hypothetical protein
MKAVFSLGTKFLTEGNFYAGFPDAEAWGCSCVLSVLLARQHVGRAELYTDARGAARLAALGLPFDAVYPAFEDFSYPPQLWMAMKLQTYRRQTEPFIHLDFDAYLWAPLPPRLSTAGIIAQSSEDNYSCYSRVLTYFLDHAGYVPAFVRAHVARYGSQIRALNAGAYGGHDLATLHASADEVFATLAHPANAPMLAELAAHHAAPGEVFYDFNILLEQCFASMYFHQRGLPVEYVLGDEPPYFTHLLASAKHHPDNVRALKNRVARDYPAYHKRVLTQLGN